MGIESGPKFNPTENPESYKIKPAEHAAETTPVSSNPESAGEIDITARKETDARESTDQVNKLGAEPKTQNGLEQKITTNSEGVVKNAIGQQELTRFEKWIKEIKKQDKIGSGAEKQVYTHPENPQQTVAVFHTNQSAHSIKERFYVNKILNFLYPDNIPNIHLAASRPAVLVIDRIRGREISPWNLKHQFSKILIRRRLSKVGILIDHNSFNFIADQDGRVFYVDGFIGNFEWNKKKLLKRIDKLRPDKKRMALSYLSRIEFLED